MTFSSDADLRFAAWAALLVPPCASTWTSASSVLLQAAPLAGLCQTAFRAELYAVAYVLHWASVSSVSVRLWSDCLGVINKFLLLTRGNVKLKLNEPNYDLWTWILDSVHCLGLRRIQLFARAWCHRSV